MNGSSCDADEDKGDFILSQDFFCTPDYITPDSQQMSNHFGFNEENLPCPKSPEKSLTAKPKRQRQEKVSINFFGSTMSFDQPLTDHLTDEADFDETKVEKAMKAGSAKKKRYVSQSAVALRCRVMPPPCIKNPYLRENATVNANIFGNQKPKCRGTPVSLIGEDGFSRYRTDFHELELIGSGNFSRVFKVLKRIDGCMYAVKHSIKQLHQDTERRRALMEVQSLSALGYHENIVGYFTSWFENKQLYIQMELCDNCLSFNNYSRMPTKDVLEVMYQIAKAFKFIHGRGIAHLDVKPENIYLKNGVYKLGDFGCATLINRTLPIEEGDSRYMPQEIFNEKYEHLDKVDIFSLGVAIYELLKGSPIPESGSQFQFIREGKLPLLPGHPLQLQNVLKAMVDPNPVRRPSAEELLQNPIFVKTRCPCESKVG